jgi:hypothetical protein
MSGTFGARFFAQYPHWSNVATEQEVNDRAALLRAHGLATLNERLVTSPPERALDTVAEHNVAIMLIGLGFVDIQYEPSSVAKPVEFVTRHGKNLYRLEVKRLAASERDRTHDRLIKALNEALRPEPCPVLVMLEIGDFDRKQTNALVRHVKQALKTGGNADHHLPSTGQWSVRYYFVPSKIFTNPHVLYAADGEVRDVTGMDSSRVKNKVKKAYDKFAAMATDDVVNIVALEMDRTVHLSTVSEALYGTERTRTFRDQPEPVLDRSPNGIFSQGRHSKLHGVLVVRRKAHRLFADYEHLLLYNPSAMLLVPTVASAFGVERVLTPDEFPE